MDIFKGPAPASLGKAHDACVAAPKTFRHIRATGGRPAPSTMPHHTSGLPHAWPGIQYARPWQCDEEQDRSRVAALRVQADRDRHPALLPSGQQKQDQAQRKLHLRGRHHRCLVLDRYERLVTGSQVNRTLVHALKAPVFLTTDQGSNVHRKDMLDVHDVVQLMLGEMMLF
jgi:hypothetical protein